MSIAVSHRPGRRPGLRATVLAQLATVLTVGVAIIVLAAVVVLTARTAPDTGARPHPAPAPAPYVGQGR